MASLLQCEDVCEVPRVLSVATILRSSEYSTPIQSHFCHSMLDPDLPAVAVTTVPSSSVWNQSRSGTYNCDADYLEDEASKDFWSEFEFSGLAMNQRGVEEINREVEDDQMGRPVLASRKRHKGLLGGVTEFN